MFCSKCGKQLAVESKFCGACGAVIPSAPTSPVPPVPSTPVPPVPSSPVPPVPSSPVPPVPSTPVPPVPSTPVPPVPSTPVPPVPGTPVPPVPSTPVTPVPSTPVTPVPATPSPVEKSGMGAIPMLLIGLFLIGICGAGGYFLGAKKATSETPAVLDSTTDAQPSGQIPDSPDSTETPEPSVSPENNSPDITVPEIDPEPEIEPMPAPELEPEPEPEVLVEVVPDYILPQSQTVELTWLDLDGLSLSELRVARNEIYARYGRMFLDTNLMAWFNSKEWYQNIPDKHEASNSNVVLSKIESLNTDTILSYETHVLEQGIIFPDLSAKALTALDLGLSTVALQKALSQANAMVSTPILEENKQKLIQAIEGA